jgi:lipopolysaccharide export system permease protein
MVAPLLLWRYILREILLHTLLGLFAISLLIVVQNMLRRLEDLLAAGVGLGALLKLMALVLPSYVSYAIPTALVFGILISLGRMSSDGELLAMRVSGISVARLLPPALLLGSVAALISAYMMFDVEPRAFYALRTTVRQLISTTNVVEPGRFMVLGDRVLYVQSLGDATCPYKGILIGDSGTDERSFYAAARCGAFESDPNSGKLSFVMNHGSIDFRDADPTRYRRILFDTMRTSLDISEYTDPPPRPRDLRFTELLAMKRLAPDDPVRIRLAGEYGTSIDTQIQRCISFPLASILLALIAVPLGIQPVRAGRSMGALTAIAVMAL